MSLTNKTIAAALVFAFTASAIPATAETVVTRKDGVTHVDAPTTRVRVDEKADTTRVKVRAPFTRVDVNTERGHVRIRVPFYSDDIRW